MSRKIYRLILSLLAGCMLLGPVANGAEYVNGISGESYSSTQIVVHASSIASLRSFVRNGIEQVQLTGYYTNGDGGGGPIRIWKDGQAAGYYVDNGGSVIVPDGGNGSGAWVWVHRQDESGSILEFGAKEGGASYDNHDHIMNAVKALKKTIIPEGIFHTTPLRFGADYDNHSVVGTGYNSVLSLIGNYAVGYGHPLVHIPQNGGVYGGTEVGAKNFHIDQVRLYGGDATGTDSTTGFVAENPDNISFGTIWSHGFYKSGMIVIGAAVRFHGERYYGYDNGNQAGAATGGQGLAISSDTTDYPAVDINYIECWGNGLANYGQGIDISKGAMTFGTLNMHDNGASGGKVATATSVHIDKFISRNNNLHAGQTFAGFYTNNDFGTITIGTFDSSGSAGSGLAFVTSGTINIDTFISDSAGSKGIAFEPASGDASWLTINHANISNSTAQGINVGGAGYSDLHIGTLLLDSNTGYGLTFNGDDLHVNRIRSINTDALPVYLQTVGGNAYIGAFESDAGAYTAAALVIAAGVNNASVITGRSSGHSATISDSGTGTYKPNVL